MARGGSIVGPSGHQPILHVTRLAIGEGKREHGLLEREAGVADTGRHVGLAWGHQGLGLEHGGQHLDAVNGHPQLLLLGTGHGLTWGAGGARGGRRRDKRGVCCGHDHRVVRLTREGRGVGGGWGH